MGASTLRLSNRQIAAGLLVCAAPFALLLFSTDWFFTTISYIDPFHYVGFFHFYNIPDYSRGAYKLARLPWILTGWLVHHILPTMAAAMVLHGMFLLAATTGMFTLAWLLFRSYEVALLGALIIGFHPAWHGSGGWDYHNTAAGAFYLWALVAVTVAARRTSLLFDAIAGAAVALAIHCNITYGCFLPILGMHYLVLSRVSSERWPHARRIASTIVAGTLGAVIVTAALSTVNWLVGREALFFQELLQITLRYTKDTTNLAAWWEPWSTGWFWMRYHLALPTSLLILSPLIWWASSRTPDRALRTIQRLVLAEFVVMAIVWSAWQFAGNLTLDFDYFTFPLLPHALLAVVVLISATMGNMHPGWIGANAFLLLGTLAIGFGDWFTAHQPLFLVAAPVVAPLALFLVAGIGAVLPHSWRTIAFAVVFSAANASSSGHPLAYSKWAPCHITAPTYRAVVESAKAIQENDPALLRTRLWFDEKDTATTRNGCPINMGQFGYSLGGIPVSYLANPFPMPQAERIPSEVFIGLAGGEDTIVIPSTSEAGPQRFLRAAAVGGVEGVVTATRRFAIDDAEISLTFLRLRTNPDVVKRTAALPGVTLADWDGDKFMSDLQVNTYAEPRPKVVQRGRAGEVLFVPATGRDHLASRFMSVPPSTKPRSLLITPVPGTRPLMRCSITVQDQNLNLLGGAPCGRSEAGQQTVIKLPTTVVQIRITFQARDQNPMLLPQRLTITEHEGAVSPSAGNGTAPPR